MRADICMGKTAECDRRLAPLLGEGQPRRGISIFRLTLTCVRSDPAISYSQ